MRERLEDAIVTRGLTKRYGRARVVDGVDLTLPCGSAMALVGANAAGKTTLLRMIVGLVRPSRGVVTISGLPVRHGWALPAVGAIIEEPTFDLPRSARRNLLRLAALGPGVPADAVDAVLERVGLTAAARRPVREFSQGMRQRLGLAAALLRDPPVLVLDEPTNGMDPAGMRLVREILAEYRDRGRSVLVSSHLLAEMQTSCDLLAVLKGGQLVFDGKMAAATEGERRVRVELDPCEMPAATAVLASRRPTRTSAGGLEVDGDDGAEVSRLLSSAEVFPRGIEEVRRSLEDFVSDLDERPDDV
jgi:ABC-2 type transport system ATP-binding protein